MWVPQLPPSATMGTPPQALPQGQPMMAPGGHQPGGLSPPLQQAPLGTAAVSPVPHPAVGQPRGAPNYGHQHPQTMMAAPQAQMQGAVMQGPAVMNPSMAPGVAMNPPGPPAMPQHSQAMPRHAAAGPPVQVRSRLTPGTLEQEKSQFLSAQARDMLDLILFWKP